MAAHQAPLYLGFSRQEHWSGFPFPSPMHESEKWKWTRLVVSDFSRPYGPSQVPLSMGYSRSEYWSGLPLPSPLSDRGVYKSRSHKDKQNMWAMTHAPKGRCEGPHRRRCPNSVSRDGSLRKELEWHLRGNKIQRHCREKEHYIRSKRCQPHR